MSTVRFGPELALLVAAGLVVLVDLAYPRRMVSLALGLLGVAAAAVWTLALGFGGGRGSAFQGTLLVDNFSLFFAVLVLAVTGAVLLASWDSLRAMGGREAEYVALMLVAATGALLLAGVNDLIAIFIALELTSVPQYILAAFSRTNRSSEAGLKYLLYGAISSAVLLYGMAFLYGATGTTSLPGIAHALSAHDGRTAAAVVGMVFVAAGFGFKMAIVPFQMWVPDVYQGAPTPVSAYLSVGSKAAGFAVALRVFLTALRVDGLATDWANMFAVLAVASMTIGNVGALWQRDIKRLLGYSSIAQAGNLLVGLAAATATRGDVLGASGVLFFVAAYAFTNLGAFIAVIALSHRLGSDEIDAYAGAWRRSPLLAVVLAFCLVSLTGIPPTAGFWAKLYIFNAAVRGGMVWLAVIGVLNSVISAAYYLGVVGVMFMRPPAEERRISLSPVVGLPLIVAAVGTLAFGLVPGPLIAAAEHAAAVFAH